MTNSIFTPNTAPVSGAFKVDVSRGGHNGIVSSQWFSRPDDQRFLNLDDLYESTRRRADGALFALLKAIRFALKPTATIPSPYA
jgi:hypothetical protein